jgi:hypothetical protein
VWHDANLRNFAFFLTSLAFSIGGQQFLRDDHEQERSRDCRVSTERGDTAYGGNRGRVRLIAL